MIEYDMAREEKAFYNLHPVLKEKYLGKYVAIYQEELVDHDDNQLELYLRIREKYGKEFVMITPVNEEVKEDIYAFRSPRLLEPINDVSEIIVSIDEPERLNTCIL